MDHPMRSAAGWGRLTCRLTFRLEQARKQIFILNEPGRHGVEQTVVAESDARVARSEADAADGRSRAAAADAVAAAALHIGGLARLAVARSSADAPEIDGVVRVVDGAHLAPGMFARVTIGRADVHDLEGRLHP